MPPAAPASSARALQAIIPLINEGQAYEAHQKARTFASRYQKAAQYAAAIDVLFQSARELLKARQHGSGTDLTVFMLDVYETAGESVSDESRGRVTQLIALTGPDGSWRKTIIDKAVAWTVKRGRHPAGDPDLHHYVGELLFKEGVLDAAEPHLLAAGKRDSARLLAQVFLEWGQATGTLSTYAGAFALRGTIPFLLNGNILAARTFLISFIPHLAQPVVTTTIPLPTHGGAEDEVLFTGEPVLNFVQLAVRVCQRAQGEHNKSMREAWVRLCGTYQSHGGLLAQPEIRQALNEIAAAYFAIPLPRAQAVNPMSEIMSSLFGGAPAAKLQRRTITPSRTAEQVELD